MISGSFFFSWAREGEGGWGASEGVREEGVRERGSSREDEKKEGICYL